MLLDRVEPILTSILVGCLFLLISRRYNILIICKSKSQRTKDEDRLIRNGALRELVLEMILFVPVSIVIFHLTIFPIIIDKLLLLYPNPKTWYAIIGLVAYGFPFLTLKSILRSVAIYALKEYSSILSDNAKKEISK